MRCAVAATIPADTLDFNLDNMWAACCAGQVRVRLEQRSCKGYWLIIFKAENVHDVGSNGIE